MACTTGSCTCCSGWVAELSLLLPLEEVVLWFTITVTEAVAVPLDTMMEVEPVPTAVTTPLALTAATEASLLL